MANCPTCFGEIQISENHYGTLLTCPLCRAVFFVSWDGLPEVSTPDPIVETSAEEPIVEHLPSPEDHTSPSVDGSFQEIFPHEIPPDPQQPPPISFEQNQNLANVPPQFETLDPSLEPVELPDLEMKPQTQDLNASFDSIQKYSNQSQETLPLSYDLLIKGLDLPQQVQEFRDAISDNRLGWEVDQLISKIKFGELRLEKLSPIKASILIQRIKYADLEIEWKQNVLK